MRALNLACLSHSFDFFVFILVGFIVRTLNVCPLCDTARSKSCDRIVRKRRKILSRASVFKFKI